MAGGRRRVEMPVRIFRLAIRDLQAAAAPPEDEFPEADEEAVAPYLQAAPPEADEEAGVRDLQAAPAPPEEQVLRALEEVEVRDLRAAAPGERVLRAYETTNKRAADSVRAQEAKKRRVDPVGAEGDTGNAKKRAAETYEEFKGKPTGAGELNYSSTHCDYSKGTSAERPKSSRNVLERGGHDKHAEKDGPDAEQKVKNSAYTVDFLSELEANYSLDIYRQNFALDHGLPLPPPSWDRVPTPPIPSSPPPSITEINNLEEAVGALAAWSDGCDMQLKVSDRLSLSVAEQILYAVKGANADGIVLNLSLLEAKASQTRFVRQKIVHCRGEIERYSAMLSLPWLPTQTVSRHL